MIFSPLNNVIVLDDEFFTLGLIKFPLMHGIAITAADVHPPLYYIILKFAIKLFSIFNFDIVFISKMATTLPYLIILFVSSTKIKDEFNWLTAGLLTFTMFSMSMFFNYYSIIRMYSWASLFLLLSFIYLKDVITKSDFKSWFLFSLFTVLGAYTHYFTAISSVILYVILLLYLMINNRVDIKKWVINAVFMVLAYCPWIIILLGQLNKVHQGYWIPDVTAYYLLQCFSVYATVMNDNLLVILLAVFFLIIILAYSIYTLRKKIPLRINIS